MLVKKSQVPPPPEVAHPLCVLANLGPALFGVRIVGGSVTVSEVQGRNQLCIGMLQFLITTALCPGSSLVSTTHGGMRPLTGLAEKLTNRFLACTLATTGLEFF